MLICLLSRYFEWLNVSGPRLEMSDQWAMGAICSAALLPPNVPKMKWLRNYET